MRTHVIAFVLTALAACEPGSPSVPEARADESAPGFAVVELFTSEGCSSCPPADDVLGDLVRSGDRRVFPLAFHVDYWDSLGWPDRFASHENTSRQGAYEQAFGLRGLYTPQMIVGGTDQFTGSDRGHAQAAIARALARGGSVHLSVHVRATAPDTLTVDYEAPGAPAGAVLNLAVVERSVSMSVRAGENAGRTLHHANVVRTFTTTALASPTGSAAIHAPSGLARDAMELIAYVQRAAGADGGMPVLAADRAALPSP